MSSIKFWQAIHISFIGKFVANKKNIIENTDPERIYIENVRHFFNVPHFMAKFFCDMAVSHGYFEKHIGVRCPKDGQIIFTVKDKSEIPDNIHCEICQLLERDKYDFSKDEVDTIVFYKLIG